MKQLDYLGSRSFGVALGLALLLPGCVAPEQSVGEETDTEGGSTTSALSDTAPETDSASSVASESMSTTGTSVTPTESDSGPVTGCSAQQDAASCEAAGCNWETLQHVEAGGDFCGFEVNPGVQPGLCFDVFNGGACPQTPVCEGDTSYWYRQLGPESYDVAERTGECPDPMPGFTACAYDGNDPDVCGCVCEPGGTPSLPPNWMDGLQAGGCGDLSIYAANPEDSIGLSLFLDEGIVAMVQSTMETYQAELDATAFTRFEVTVGQFVSVYECTDVIENKPNIEGRWSATGGTVSLEVVPNAGGMEGGFATITFNNVQLSSGLDDVIVLDGITYEDIFVGWFPG